MHTATRSHKECLYDRYLVKDTTEHECESVACHLVEEVPGFGEVGCIWRGNRRDLPNHECAFRTAEASCALMVDFARRVSHALERLEENVQIPLQDDIDD